MGKQAELRRDVAVLVAEAASISRTLSEIRDELHAAWWLLKGEAAPGSTQAQWAAQHVEGAMDLCKSLAAACQGLLDRCEETRRRLLWGGDGGAE